MCSRKVTIARDGSYCPACAKAFHRACTDDLNCPDCGTSLVRHSSKPFQWDRAALSPEAQNASGTRHLLLIPGVLLVIFGLLLSSQSILPVSIPFSIAWPFDLLILLAGLFCLLPMILRPR